MELVILVATAAYLLMAVTTLRTKNFVSSLVFKFVPAILAVALVWLIVSKYNVV